MELATISMDRTEARAAFLEYRRALDHRRHPRPEEDEALMRAYRELAKGAMLIELMPTLREGGLTTIGTPPPPWAPERGETPVHVPRLAVARADAAWLWTAGVDRSGAWTARVRRDIAPHNKRDRVTFPAGLFDHDDERKLDTSWTPRIRALVPQPPPRLRPTKAHLRNYVVLWEAEWEIDQTVPPGDPVLLKHVGGDLYAVVAQWDLTPLEQAVLRRRAPVDA